MLAAVLACAALAAPAAASETTQLAELPHPDSRPAGITALADGTVWFTELDGRPDGTGRIARLATDGLLTEFALPTVGSLPTSIVAGPDGNLWFTESGIDKIGRITPEGAITEFGGLTAGAAPQDITVGPDAALWFTEGGYNRGNRIGRIDPVSGAVKEFCIRRCDRPPAYADAGLHPAGIATGPDGRVWFAESNPDRGDDGADYGDQGTGYIGAITTDGTVTEYPVPTFNAQPHGIVTGPDGNLWFTEFGDAGNRVGRITTAGEISELGQLATSASRPGPIIAPGDGNLWLAEGAGNRLASIDPAGTGIELDPLSDESESQAEGETAQQTGMYPAGLAVDPAGNLWITELRGNRLARATVDLPKKDTESQTAPAQAAPPAAANDAQAAITAARTALKRVLNAVRRRLDAKGLARLRRSGRLMVSLKAPAAGLLTVRVVASPGKRKVVVAALRRVFRTAGSGRAKLKATRAGRRLLARRRVIRATLTATFVPASGKRLTASRRLVLRQAARARRTGA